MGISASACNQSQQKQVHSLPSLNTPHVHVCAAHVQSQPGSKDTLDECVRCKDFGLAELRAWWQDAPSSHFLELFGLDPQPEQAAPGQGTNARVLQVGGGNE
jgi:hypothetical protein